MHANKTITILAAAAALFVAAALLHQLTVEAAPARNSDPRRAYYVTKTSHSGSQALTACAAGYHMASLHEIATPSALRFETTLGWVLADQGSGPPTGLAGWVRTGMSDFMEHCQAWTSDDGDGFSLRFALLPMLTDWTPGVLVERKGCASVAPVWCIQD